MNIRPMIKDDVEGVQSLVMSLAHFYLKSEDDSLPGWFVDTISSTEFTARIDNSGFANFLCEIDGEVAGYISIKSGDHLYHLFVAEKHQRKGVARLLWQYALNYCIHGNCTLRSSLFAVPVYKKLGFIETGPRQEKDGIRFQPMSWQR